MTGKDFLQVAVQLASQASEPHWRSATSRAYYAAFHVAREALEQNGVHIPENATGHERVIRCLNNAQDIELAKAAANLGTLRSSRITADYRLRSASFSRSQAAISLAWAKGVLKGVEESPLKTGNPSKVLAAIEKYLRSVNQWYEA
jgi:uncharacterized protein (UPF0332 family)